MGRGRAKAKQTKVARQLKYNTPDMDLASLQQELHGGSADDDYSQDYSQWADNFEDED